MEKTTVPSKTLRKDYDALQDRHASFYFNGHGVKRHLKKLKKAVQMQSNSKSYQQYASMLDKKINELDQQSQSSNIKIKPYEQTLKPASLYKLKKMQTFFEEAHIKQRSLDKKMVNKTYDSTSQHLPNLKKLNTQDKSATEAIIHNSSNENKIKTITATYNQRFDTALFKRRNFEIGKDRSNKSVQLLRGYDSKRKTFSKAPIKEVKHDDFMSFLKEKQELLQNSSKELEKDDEHEQKVINGQEA